MFGRAFLDDPVDDLRGGSKKRQKGQKREEGSEDKELDFPSAFPIPHSPFSISSFLFPGFRH
jgi:hypothetical protein